MNLQILLSVVVIAGSLTACAEKELLLPEQGYGTAKTGSAIPNAPVLPSTSETIRGSDAFLTHMHGHASQLGRLNAALAAGDLDAAQTPAYWLAEHDRLTEIPDDWRVYVNEMSNEARAVADASDITAARAAARRIADGCQGCHAAQARDIELPSGPGY